jgi:hypothetical protein
MTANSISRRKFPKNTTVAGAVAAGTPFFLQSLPGPLLSSIVCHGHKPVLSGGINDQS